MITLIKLKDNTELIGYVDRHQGGYQVADPFIIHYRLAVGQPIPSISMSRYMPFSSKHVHLFGDDEVRHAVEPSASFSEYYANTLQYCKEVVDDHVDRELTVAADKAKSSRDDLLEVYQAIIDRTRFDGPLN